MAVQTPDTIELDEQDQSEAFDETHTDEDEAEFVTFEELDDVFDSTSALGDGRDSAAVDAADLDPDALDDDDLEDDADLDDMLDDDLEDAEEDDGLDDEDDDEDDGVTVLEWNEADVQSVADVDAETDPADGDADDYESDDLTDEQLRELGYEDEDERPAAGQRPEDVPDQVHPHQDELLDEGVEETFPASDPVSVKRIT
jgi:ribonuclease E